MTRLDVWEAAYGDRNSEFDEALDDLLAAERLLERHATVERIRERLNRTGFVQQMAGVRELVNAILDDEAAR